MSVTNSAAPETEAIGRILDQVTQLAAMADIHMDRHPETDDMLVAGFNMGGGRSQTVFVRYVGESDEGNHCVSFMSPCMDVRRLPFGFGGVGRRRAIELLRRNSVLPFGNFALQRFDKNDVLVVQSSQIVETMEIEELKTHVIHVAGIADAFEAEIGRDAF